MQNASRTSPQHPTFADKQRGAAAIEFALVFVVFFAVLYGLMSYSLPLLMMQSFNTAATEAVRRAVAVDPATNNYITTVKSQASATVASQLSWMPTALAIDASSIQPTFDGKLLTVTITYPQSKLTNVMPLIVLPFVGTVPNLPANLIATASLQLVP
ncbi:TadE/TadG family type IV pilus assembly protein [Pseudomonas sp. NA-150]|uniref:TadE/TadG family type IV pilus assembly protein n=1 Tax=Pseudomonas sp. NA-150 TaxID=3367525 RepID=UPI0037C64210